VNSNPDRHTLSLAELAELYIQCLRDDDATFKATRDRPRSEALLVDQPQAGDVWKARGGPEDSPIVVVVTWVEGSQARGVVVLDEPELATAEDYLVPLEESPLGTPIALCVWRDIPLTTGSLYRRIGQLSPEVMEPLAMLLQDRLTGGFVRRPFASATISTGEHGVRWSIEPDDGNGPELSFVTGAPVIRKADPRLKVREELSSRSAYLEAAALAELVSAPTGVVLSFSIGEHRDTFALAASAGASNVAPAQELEAMFARAALVGDLVEMRDGLSKLPESHPYRPHLEDALARRETLIRRQAEAAAAHHFFVWVLLLLRDQSGVGPEGVGVALPGIVIPQDGIAGLPPGILADTRFAASIRRGFEIAAAAYPPLAGGALRLAGLEEVPPPARVRDLFVDESAGLPALVAGVWHGRGLRPARAVAFTGKVSEDGDVEEVDGVAAKARAVRQAGVDIIVCPGHPRPGDEIDGTLRIPNAPWHEWLAAAEEALQALGIELLPDSSALLDAFAVALGRINARPPDNVPAVLAAERIVAVTGGINEPYDAMAARAGAYVILARASGHRSQPEKALASLEAAARIRDAHRGVLTPAVAEALRDASHAIANPLIDCYEFEAAEQFLRTTQDDWQTEASGYNRLAHAKWAGTWAQLRWFQARIEPARWREDAWRWAKLSDELIAGQPAEQAQQKTYLCRMSALDRDEPSFSAHAEQARSLARSPADRAYILHAEAFLYRETMAWRDLAALREPLEGLLRTMERAGHSLPWLVGCLWRDVALGVSRTHGAAAAEFAWSEAILPFEGNEIEDADRPLRASVAIARAAAAGDQDERVAWLRHALESAEPIARAPIRRLFVAPLQATAEEGKALDGAALIALLRRALY
jgi:hypothetical protein